MIDKASVLEPCGRASLRMATVSLMVTVLFVLAQLVRTDCQQEKAIAGDLETRSNVIVNANPRVQHHRTHHILSEHLHAHSPQREALSVYGTGSRLSLSPTVRRGIGAFACAHGPTTAAWCGQGQDLVSRRRFFEVAGCGGAAAGIAIAAFRKSHRWPIQTVDEVTTVTNRTPGTALTFVISIMQRLCKIDDNTLRDALFLCV